MPFFKKDEKEILLRDLREQRYDDEKEKMGFLSKLKESGDVDPLEILWMVGHKDHNLREFGDSILFQTKDLQFLKSLLEEIKDSDEARRHHITILIGKLKLPRLKFYLSQMIQSEDTEERVIAMEILMNHPNWQAYMGIARRALRDPVVKIRHMAVMRLGQAADDEKVFLMLRRMCEDPAEIVRHKVLRIMAELNRADVVEPFFERLPYEPPQIQQEIIKALIRLSKKRELQIEDHVFPALFDEDEIVRNAASELLQEMPEKTEILRKLFIYTHGVSFWLRERCLDFAKRLSPDIVESLTNLMDDPEEDIRVLAMFLAKEVGDKRSIPAIKRLLINETEWWIRISCVDILSQFKSPEMSEFLLGFMDDPDLRWSIISALGKINDPCLINHLLKNLKDSRPSIRMITLNALEQFPSPPLLNDLKEIYETDPDKGVRQKAFQLIQKLANRGDSEAAEIVETKYYRGLRLLIEEESQLEMEDQDLIQPVELVREPVEGDK